MSRPAERLNKKQYLTGRLQGEHIGEIDFTESDQSFIKQTNKYLSKQ